MLVCESRVEEKAVGQALSYTSETQSLFPGELRSFLGKLALPEQKWSLSGHLNPARGGHGKKAAAGN